MADTYLTIHQFCEKHKAFKLGGVKSLVFNRQQNGLLESGAILKIGKKLIIDEEKFFDWIRNVQSKGIIFDSLKDNGHE